ncbi:hypothetical protein N7493_009911 [Penicillium malachiteum]|uniref:Ankyrin repeat protein n=1 Tax=Penicillium malachiteum TaxID=1324776 RepID=A0AAD6HDX0_9EURO|nr:hypothetical protein N7493_009911 [Penicillium malachiteum]
MFSILFKLPNLLIFTCNNHVLTRLSDRNSGTHGRSLESQADINALLQTNRRLYQIFKTYLYRFNASFFTGSALLWAVRHNQPQTAHYALQNGVAELLDWDREPLHCAAENGDRDMVLLLLQYEAGVDCKRLNKTPLYVAGAQAYNCHAEVVKLLLEKGADTDAETSQGDTPLSQALHGSQYDIFWLLFDHGTRFQGRHSAEMRIFHEAALGNHIEIVWGLLEKGLDPNARDGEGYTALTGAAVNSNREVVRLLIEKGADLEAKNDDGNTALGACAYFGRETPVEILLDCGADPNSRDTRGNTPLHLALNETMAQLLLSRGAILDAVNDDGQTPLSQAVQLRNDGMEQFLLRYIAGKSQASAAALGQTQGVF